MLRSLALSRSERPWYHSEPHTYGSGPQSELRENRAAYLKRNHACFIWLSSLCHVHGTALLTPFCIAYYSQGKKSDAWDTTAFTYLQVYADTGPVKTIWHRCSTYAVTEVMFFSASKQRIWSQLHYLSKNLTWRCSCFFTILKRAHSSYFSRTSSHFLLSLTLCKVRSKRPISGGVLIRKRGGGAPATMLICHLSSGKHIARWHISHICKGQRSGGNCNDRLVIDGSWSRSRGWGGTASVRLLGGHHATQMKPCITQLWCHRSSAPLKPERLGTRTTEQPPTTPALCPWFQKQYPHPVAKTQHIS